MEWQLHAAFEPSTNEELRDAAGLEAALASLAPLHLSTDRLAQIRAALAPHWVASHPMVLRIFVSFQRREHFSFSLNDWRFFFVLPGAISPLEPARQMLDLYLY